jgi:tetratricopeptide (TPR) repeat protein
LVLVGIGAACTRAEDPLVRIRELHARGRFAESVDPLRKLVDQDPARPETHLLLGVALLRTGEAGLAVWPLRRAAESPDHAVEAGILLTRAMLESRSAHDAVAAIDRVLSIDPDNVDALELRVEAHLATGSPAKALEDIDRVLELDPENLAVLAPRVLALIALERIDEAEAALETARERLASAGDEVSPSARARLCIASGLFAFEKGDAQAADAQYEDCLEKFPTDPLAVSEAVTFFDRTGRPERATEILRGAFERSGDAAFRIALARRMGAQGDAQAEERLLREEAEERPSAASWFALADHYVQRDEFDAALEAFEQALAASPDPTPMLRFAYADTLVQAERFEQAMQVAEEIEPQALRDLIRGRVLLGQGDAKGALAAFEAGIRLWPNNPAARFLAGQAAERAGDYERATSEYRESIRANPAQTKAGLALGELYAVQGDQAGALDALRRYVQTHPEDPEGYLVSIRIAHRAGQHSIAAEGLARLAVLPGQAARAKAEEATLLAVDKGPALAVEAVESSGLDLTDPSKAPALRVLLTQLAALGDHARAEALVRSALQAHPDEAVFHELRGRALRAAARPPEKVREAFERALALDPQHAPALVGLAELSAEAGERAAALALYDRATEADPDDPGPAYAAARLLLEAQETREAEARLEKLLEQHPREASAAHELARILVERGDLDRALGLAERAAWFRAPGADETLARIRELRGEGISVAPGSPGGPRAGSPRRPRPRARPKAPQRAAERRLHSRP